MPVIEIYCWDPDKMAESWNFVSILCFQKYLWMYGSQRLVVKCQLQSFGLRSQQNGRKLEFCFNFMFLEISLDVWQSETWCKMSVIELEIPTKWPKVEIFFIMQIYGFSCEDQFDEQNMGCATAGSGSKWRSKFFYYVD